MNKNSLPDPVCSNTFRTEDRTLRRERLTELWIRRIRLEEAGRT